VAIVGSWGAECDLDALFWCIRFPDLVDQVCDTVCDALGIPRLPRGGGSDG
jgi:hypothetical protein